MVAINYYSMNAVGLLHWHLNLWVGESCFPSWLTPGHDTNECWLIEVKLNRLVKAWEDKVGPQFSLFTSSLGNETF